MRPSRLRKVSLPTPIPPLPGLVLMALFGTSRLRSARPPGQSEERDLDPLS